MRVYGRLATVLLAFALMAPAASALVVHNRHGHFFGIALHRGARSTSIPGSVASTKSASSLAQATSSHLGDTLDYQGGPVLHSSSAYLIFWDPNGHIPSSSEQLMERYFTDVAADSGNTNVYAVDHQYTDGSGFAGATQSFSSGQAIVDSQSYPAEDTTNCPDYSGYTACVTDIQVQQELARLIGSDKLPTDGSSQTALPDGAPIYFVVLPEDVNECYNDGSSNSCADQSNGFCAYHSSFGDTIGSTSYNVLYAAIPTLVLGSDPKGCQYDGNSAVQEPNGDSADVVLKYTAHEDQETITDPLGTGWWSSASGNEIADDCNATGSLDATKNTDPNAFLPTLGGNAGAGTLYDEVINGHDYYLQSLWSNSDGNCEMKPTSGTVTPQFSTPGGPNSTGTALSFNPSGSSSTNPYSSVTWNWGDGTSTFTSGTASPATTSHTYSAAGTYTVTLTLVDNRGTVASVAHQVTVYAPPVASYSYSPTPPIEAVPVSFNASGSSDPNHSGTVTSYSWNFGDPGSSSNTATGATPSHTFATPGTYTVALTVTSSEGLTSTTSQRVTVDPDIPSASFTASPSQAAVNQGVSFDGSSSSDAYATITAYAWNFGDPGSAGNTATGQTATHTFAAPGTYTVTLTVTNTDNQTDTVTHQVTAGPVPAFNLSPSQPTIGSPTEFNASGTNPAPGSTITSYSWNFGDPGSATNTATGETAAHTYATPGTYTVTLTVKNNLNQTEETTQAVTVVEVPPAAAFTADPTPVLTGEAVALNAASSSDPDGTITSYAWNFGDGSSTNEATPTASHAYDTAGTYTVTLTVTDSNGLTNTVSEPLTVTAPPAPPPASAASVSSSAPPPAAPTAAIAVTTANPVTGRPVAFSASHSSGSIVAYRWSFGDGSTGTGAAPTHAYAHAGVYSVALTVTDGTGRSSTAVRSLTVAGWITKVEVKSTRGRATVSVSVSSAGALTVGHRVFHLKRAGTVGVTITLSREQLRMVAAKHVVKVRVALRFAPAVGPASASSAVIAFRLTSPRGRIAAALTR